MICRFVALHTACVCLFLNMVAAGHCENNSTAALPVVQKLQQWLHGPMRVEVRNEVNGAVAAFETENNPDIAGCFACPECARGIGALRRRAVPSDRARDGLGSEVLRTGAAPGHEVTIELPLLAQQQQIFTPTERGVMDLAAYPTFTPVAYAHMGSHDRRCYVLPLVSVFDPKADTAVTVALPADANTPHLQIDWQDAKTLRLRLAHRAMGGGKPASIRLLFYVHPADYRAAIKMYSDDFPATFARRCRVDPTRAPFSITTSRTIPISRKWPGKTCVTYGPVFGSRTLASTCPTRRSGPPSPTPGYFSSNSR